MRKLFLLRGNPGMDMWYGWQPKEVHRIFEKNLFIFERIHEISTHNISVNEHEVRLLFEGEPSRVRRFCRDLIHSVNRQLQHNSSGLYIFSGGLKLEELLF